MVGNTHAAHTNTFLSPAEIWDALKAAVSLDESMAKAVLEAAEVKVMRPDMSICYDARGFRYAVYDALSPGGSSQRFQLSYCMQLCCIESSSLGHPFPPTEERFSGLFSTLRLRHNRTHTTHRYELPNFVLCDPANLVQG